MTGEVKEKKIYTVQNRCFWNNSIKWRYNIQKRNNLHQKNIKYTNANEKSSENNCQNYINNLKYSKKFSNI